AQLCSCRRREVLRPSAEKRERVPVLFGTVLFVNALLVFWVQPLFAKIVLPLLGGSPSVWTTCTLFFQVALLVGYAYSHAGLKWLGVSVRHSSTAPSSGCHCWS